jgi:protein disulfide-isomerase
MKKWIAVFIFSSILLSPSAKANETSGLTWYTNLDSVVTLSNATNKPIFAFFTGSDWCGWCIKLQREVFAKQAFIDWASEHVILLELDFPRTKALPQDLKVQNQNLQQAFAVTGYPTIWVFTAVKDEVTLNYQLTAWGKLGYPQGAEKGKEEVKFLADAEGVLAKNPAAKSD